MQSTPWNRLRRYASPAFFEVLPAGAAASTLFRLSHNALRGRRFRALRDALGTRPVLSDVAVGAGPPGVPLGADLSREERRRLGDAILRVFFVQVLGPGPVILDLRPSGLRRTADGLAWSPSPAWVEWAPEFQAGVTDVFTGLYRDEARLDAGLDALGMTAARAAMLRNFGGPQIRGMHFDMASFADTFADLFEACAQAGERLSGDFASLGILLATLYQSLEVLGTPQDVCAAFEAAAQSTISRAAGSPRLTYPRKSLRVSQLYA